MRALVLLSTVCAFFLAVPCAAQPDWKPERAIEIVMVSAGFHEKGLRSDARPAGEAGNDERSKEVTR
jgi:hypothetical protein